MTEFSWSKYEYAVIKVCILYCSWYSHCIPGPQRSSAESTEPSGVSIYWTPGVISHHPCGAYLPRTLLKVIALSDFISYQSL